MKASKTKKNKRPMSLSKKVGLAILGIALVAVLIYLAYYLIHYVAYDEYKDYFSSYSYEQGGAYTPIQESAPDVKGMELVCENDILKLYTDTATANVAVYDKRNGNITYSNPLNADEDPVANTANKNYLKSQFMLTYYNSDVTAGTYDSYTKCVKNGNFKVESIANGVRYIYTIGDPKAIYFDIPLEYRLEGDHLTVSIPASGINEYGGGYVQRIQLLRYMGAASSAEDGYMVVPNGSGSIINFNNGKTKMASYSQYVYDLDPLAANYTTLENTDSAKLALFGICKEDNGLLVTIEDGASTSLITAGISGAFNDYNYAYPTFVLRTVDNLSMFGDGAEEVFVIEEDLYDINMEVRYTFLTEENAGYAGLANYYRERLINEGALTKSSQTGDIPFYYDVICGVKETNHMLGVQYLRNFAMTTFEEAGDMSTALKNSGINNQVMNLQGWFNGGFYHDTPDKVKVTWKLGGKSDLEDLNETVVANGGTLYADVEFQRVTFADDDFNYTNESSRYYGAGYVASFGQVNPTTLRNTSGLGYSETKYDVLSPKYLPRYVEKFTKKIDNVDIAGISLRDLGSYLASDKRRTNVIHREKALDIVDGQLQLLENTGKKLMTDAGNDYSFGYTTDIINAPIYHNEFFIVDESIPLYEMILHGYINYSSELMNFQDDEDLTPIVLNMIEAGASPHYVFTWEESSKMKETGLNSYYATTFNVWKDEAISIYSQVNEALKYVNGAAIIDHEIVDTDARKVTYDNGVVIYINYGSNAVQVDGVEVPALSYRMEGI
ncbi:MAG: hypothetical protein IJX63_15085 [Lachnospiraceae bacterium]|nr:hypothetical protein [Lachnospiraceae bacterium]